MKNLCECCGKKHNGRYATGRFCSKKCACSFSTKSKRKEINKKVSERIKKKIMNRVPEYIKNGKKKCTMCLETKLLSEFYKNGKGYRVHSYCKKCFTFITLERQREFKKKCLEYKGGLLCSMCGYDKHIGALEFHHLDPEAKEFDMSRARLKTFNENTKKELDKCIVVCRNCHSEIHGVVLVI